jgi:nucleoside-diphosphate-sugar epimerase
VGALTRRTARAEALRGVGVKPAVAADVAGDAWHGEFDPAGAAIVYCVAPAKADAEGYRQAFVEGVQSMARWLEKSSAPAAEILFTSATSVYAQTDGSWVDEATPVSVELLGAGAAQLREAEELVLALAPRLARRAWVLRLAGLYGPERHYLLDALRAGRTTFPGDGEQWLNLLHRDDAVSAIRACLRAPVGISGGIFNAADDAPVRKRELIAWLAGTLRQDTMSFEFTPGASARSAHRRTASGATPNRRVANQRLREILSWRPAYPSYREGYREILSSS